MSATTMTIQKDEENRASVASSVKTADESVKETNGKDAIPDAGVTAWLQVLSSFLVFFNAWGTVSSFGVYQTYYQTTLLPFESPSTIAWIGSIQAFLLSFVGIVTGPLYDAGYTRQLSVVGILLLSLGLMTASLSTQWWHLLLSQAFCVGLGAGSMFIPAIAVIAQWFDERRRTLAMGAAISGASLGGVIYPIVFHRLIGRVGYPWTMRTIGFIAFATCVVSLVLRRERIVRDGKKRVMLEPRAFKEPPYVLFCAASFMSYLGFFNPQFFIGPYAIEKAGVDDSLAFYLLPIINAASTVGRFTPGLFVGGKGSGSSGAGRPLESYVLSAFVSGVLALAWIGISNAGGLIAFCILYGFASGALISLPSVVLTNMTKDHGRLGTRMGMVGVIKSFAGLVGTPIAGALLGADGGSYLGVQIYTGLAMFLTAIFGFGIRVFRDKS